MDTVLSAKPQGRGDGVRFGLSCGVRTWRPGSEPGGPLREVGGALSADEHPGDIGGLNFGKYCLTNPN